MILGTDADADADAESTLTCISNFRHDVSNLTDKFSYYANRTEKCSIS